MRATNLIKFWFSIERTLPAGGFARKVLIELLLCAISVSSAPLWLTNIRENNHRDTGDRGVAQRNQTFRAKPRQAILISLILFQVAFDVCCAFGSERSEKCKTVSLSTHCLIGI